MLWMHINVLQSLILRMSTSSLAFNFSAVVKPTVCQIRRARHCLKTYTHKHTKPPVQLDLQDHNGVTQDLSPNLQDHNQVLLQTTGAVVDLLRLILHLNHLTHMIKEKLVAQGLDLEDHCHLSESPALVKSNK